MSIEPALTPAEWAAYPNSHLIRMEGADYGAASVNYFPTPHGIAAMNLHDQPFGFTHEDVDLLRSEAEWLTNEWENDSASVEVATAIGIIADRIEALLPPKDEAHNNTHYQRTSSAPETAQP